MITIQINLSQAVAAKKLPLTIMCMRFFVVLGLYTNKF